MNQFNFKLIPAMVSVVLLVSSCTTPILNTDKPTDRIPSSSDSVCDLNTDRCGGKPLDEAQTAKTFFLTDLVTAKLSQIEVEEKAKGRDFKVAFISRMGSNLEKFQPLIDINKNGQTMNAQELIQQLLIDSKVAAESKPDPMNTIPDAPTNYMDPQVMRKQYDRSRKLKYSHVGIAVKNLVLKDKDGKVLTGPETGKWAMIHLLYTCDAGHQSYIYKGTIGSFFYDHMNDYGTQIMVPEQKLQNNLDQILIKDYLGKQWVEKHYNALALVDDLDQQNSNQWVAEVIAAAMYPAGQVTDRKQAQQILKTTNYQPTKVTPTGLYSALKVPFVGKVISSFMPTVCISGQSNIKNYGIAEIISALSIEEYLKKNNRLSSVHEVELTKEDKTELDQLLGKSKKSSATTPTIIKPN